MPHSGAHTVTRSLGSQSGLQVTVLGMGGASLGDLYTRIPDSQALAALEAAHESGIAFFDTAPWYGVGLSEARFGLALHRLPRDSFVLQTKVGRYLVPDPQARNGQSVGWLAGYHFTPLHDYSAAALERQLQDSLQRTGLGRVDSLVIHDLEPCAAGGASPATFEQGAVACRHHLEVLRTSGIHALRRLREAGAVRAFGAGVNSDEGGEDPAKKAAWNVEYVDALLALGSGGGRGLDFLLCARRAAAPPALFPLATRSPPARHPLSTDLLSLFSRQISARPAQVCQPVLAPQPRGAHRRHPRQVPRGRDGRGHRRPVLLRHPRHRRRPARRPRAHVQLPTGFLCGASAHARHRSGVRAARRPADRRGAAGRPLTSALAHPK